MSSLPEGSAPESQDFGENVVWPADCLSGRARVLFQKLCARAKALTENGNDINAG